MATKERGGVEKERGEKKKKKKLLWVVGSFRHVNYTKYDIWCDVVFYVTMIIVRMTLVINK
jgi:hypothetical protein